MKDKKNTKNKNESSGLFKSSKILKDVYDAKYDFSELKIVAVDGALTYLDKEEGRILFFVNIPDIHNKKDKEIQVNKALIEARMSSGALKRIAKGIVEEILYFEDNKTEGEEDNFKIKKHEEVMFG